MFHGLNNGFLYSALKVTSTFHDDSGKSITTSGTGFFLHAKGRVFFATNRHVLDAAYSKDKYKNFRLSMVKLDGRVDGDSLVSVFIPPEINRIAFSKNSENDIAIVPDPKIQIVGVPGQNLTIQNAIPEALMAGVGDFETRLSVCDFVAFPGYPEWHDKVAQRPIFRGGTIASDPRFNYSTDRPMGDCVAYEAFSFGGSSGSPVFALQKGLEPGPGIKFDGYRPPMFIGLNAGHLPSAEAGHSGISYFYKSTAILEIIESC